MTMQYVVLWEKQYFRGKSAPNPHFEGAFPAKKAYRKQISNNFLLDWPIDLKLRLNTNINVPHWKIQKPEVPRPHKMAAEVFSAEPTSLNNSTMYEPILMKLETWTHHVPHNVKNTKPEVPRPHKMAAKIFKAENV